MVFYGLPKIWHEGKEHARLWIKIKNIKEEHTLKADMFRIISTGANLKQVISNSQFHFGYVYLEDVVTETVIPFKNFAEKRKSMII